MASSTSHSLNTNMIKVALRSKNTPNIYLSMNGQGVTQFLGSGGGKVTTAKSVGPNETLLLELFNDGTVSFESTVFNNVFLRLDGTNVPAGKITGPGGGVVNCQFGSFQLERYKIITNNTHNGVVSIESNAFPGRFLRCDGAQGIVNVQGVASTLEEWEILVLAT